MVETQWQNLGIATLLRPCFLHTGCVIRNPQNIRRLEASAQALCFNVQVADRDVASSHSAQCCFGVGGEYTMLL